MTTEADRERRRRDNAKRSAQKRAWENEHDRGTCERCGGPTRVGGKRHGTRHCIQCYDAARRAARLERAHAIERMWAAGATTRVIGEAIGMSLPSLRVEISRLRTEGLANIPHRRTPEQVARIREGRWGREAMKRAA